MLLATGRTLRAREAGLFGLLFLVLAGVVFGLGLFPVAFGFHPIAAMRVGHGFLAGQGMAFASSESEGESGERENEKTGHRAGGG